MFDSRYYQLRKEELTRDFNESKDKTFNRLLQTIAEWQQDAQKLQQRFQEIDAREKEHYAKSNKKDEDNPVKKKK